MPFALTGLSVMIYFHIDTVMLSMLVNEKAVGIYRAAYNIVLAATTFSSAFVIALFPMIARLYETERENAVKLSSDVIFYALIFSLPIAFGGTLIASQFIGQLYLPSFGEAAFILQILLVGAYKFCHIHPWTHPRRNESSALRPGSFHSQCNLQRRREPHSHSHHFFCRSVNCDSVDRIARTSSPFHNREEAIWECFQIFASEETSICKRFFASGCCVGQCNFRCYGSFSWELIVRKRFIYNKNGFMERTHKT